MKAKTTLQFPERGRLLQGPDRLGRGFFTHLQRDVMMAGDWIKIREDLHEDAAVLNIADRLKVRPEVVVGYLVRFWSWVSRNTDDGTISGVSIDSVEQVLNLPHFLGFMRDVGWLEYIEDTSGKALIIPHFERHLSESAKKRAKDQRRKQEDRKRPQSVRAKTDKSRTREEESKSKSKRRSKEPPKSPTGDFDPTKLEMPFPSADFVIAWSDFSKMRREIRKPLRETGAKASLKKLGAMGEARAIAALEHTTANEWQGIREPEQPVAKKPKYGEPGFKQRVATEEEMEAWQP